MEGGYSSSCTQAIELVRSFLFLRAAADHTDGFVDDAVEIHNLDTAGLQRVQELNGTSVPFIFGVHQGYQHVGINQDLRRRHTMPRRQPAHLRPG